MSINRGFGLLGAVVIIPVALIALILVLFGFLEVRKMYWDWKVSGMCEREAGIKVFKITELPEDEFKKYLNAEGQFSLPNAKYARPDQAYVYSMESQYVVEGNLEVRKDVYRILTRLDGIILSEETSFSRVGGDFPTVIGHPTSFSCPRSKDSIFEKTFKRVSGTGS